MHYDLSTAVVMCIAKYIKRRKIQLKLQCASDEMNLIYAGPLGQQQQQQQQQCEQQQQQQQHHQFITLYISIYDFKFVRQIMLTIMD